MTQRARVRMLIQSVIDGGIGVTMFVAAYLLRFETDLVPAPKGQPPIEYYEQLAPSSDCCSLSVCGCREPTATNASGPGSTTSSRCSSAA